MVFLACSLNEYLFPSKSNILILQGHNITYLKLYIYIYIYIYIYREREREKEREREGEGDREKERKDRESNITHAFEIK